MNEPYLKRFGRWINAIEKEIKCGICGNHFLKNTKAIRYCSDECRKVASKKSMDKWLLNNKHKESFKSNHAESAKKWKNGRMAIKDSENQHS